jgi:aerobic carbon-monoxide dehydrogenase medium subunit
LPSNVTRARSLAEALELLERFGGDGAPLAGATWVMRERRRRSEYVALDRLVDLRAVEAGDEEVRLGALATHDQLADSLVQPALAAVREAARSAAFPAVRSVATVGGNICATPFPEADLVPALLACAAEVELATVDGTRRVPLLESVPSGALLTHVLVPAPANRRSCYRRLTVRGGGEYAVASVALSVDLDEDGVVRAAQLALGSVEQRPRLFAEAAHVLVGGRLDEARGRAAGERAAAACEPREGLDAPAWYRRAVLPVLVGDAAAQLAA